MHRKIPVKPKKNLKLFAEEEMFLETSEADLLSRWRKEIRSFSRKGIKLRPSRKIVVPGKN